MSVVKTLNPAQKQAVSTLVARCIAKGVTNHYSQGALLAIAQKESNLNLLASEGSYATTSNDRIRKIFSKTRAMKDEALTFMKAHPKEFFDFVYDGIAGNGPLDGYKFRGRGPNQLTGKGNYAAIGKKIGVDLVANPDLLSTNKTVAADAFIQYFIDGMATGKRLGKLAAYNSTGINDFKNLTDSLGAFYHANAGWGKSIDAIKADPTGGLTKAKSTVSDFYAIVSNKINENKAASGTGLFFLILGAIALANRKKISAWITKQKTSKK